ncbi:hypothetical protein HUN59_05425, partial [Curtobacterium sp. Csp2]|uniref:pyridoxine 5'-phosphate oxidase C-terminal domain-containing protein n=1 Tax=Curtobacterium sp. Csp2 TaxID=2495430 RepID=UPI00159A0D65
GDLQVLAWVNDREAAERDPERRRRVWADFTASRGGAALDPPSTWAGEHRRRVWADFTASRGGAALDPPSTWAGYALTPHRMVFWRGAIDAASHRTAYERGPDGSWSQESWPG